MIWEKAESDGSAVFDCGDYQIWVLPDRRRQDPAQPLLWQLGFRVSARAHWFRPEHSGLCVDIESGFEAAKKALGAHLREKADQVEETPIPPEIVSPTVSLRAEIPGVGPVEVLCPVLEGGDAN